MKNILLMSLSMVFLCSCSFKEKEVIADPTITVEPASTQNIGEDASERDYRGLIPETSNIKDQIKEKFLFYPTVSSLTWYKEHTMGCGWWSGSRS